MGHPKSLVLWKWNREVNLHFLEFPVIRELSFRDGRSIGIRISAFS